MSWRVSSHPGDYEINMGALMMIAFCMIPFWIVYLAVSIWIIPNVSVVWGILMTLIGILVPVVMLREIFS